MTSRSASSSAAFRAVVRHMGTRPRLVCGGLITEYRPTTAALRQALGDRALPKVVRNYVYAWLLVRRHRSRRLRHGHAG